MLLKVLIRSHVPITSLETLFLFGNNSRVGFNEIGINNRIY